MIPQQTSVFRSIPIVAFYETGAKHLITHPKQGASHANYARLFRSKPLIFVRRGVSYCNAVARATAALLGRFLPRLGPLATRERPLFLPFAFSNSTQPPPSSRQLLSSNRSLPIQWEARICEQWWLPALSALLLVIGLL